MKIVKRQPWKAGFIAGVTLLSAGLSAARAQTTLSAQDVETRLQALSSRLGIATTATATTALAGSDAQANTTAPAPVVPVVRPRMTLQSPPVHFASYNASLGRFVVATRHFLSVTGGLSGKKPEGATATATYDPKALTRSSDQVLSKGRRLSGALRKQLDSRPPVERLALSSSNGDARDLRSAISTFVMRLQEVPAGNLSQFQLRALNQVVEDTTTLTVLLDSVTPVEADTSATESANRKN